VTSSGEALSPSQATQKKALVIDCGPDIDKLLDGVLKSDGWSVRRVPDNQSVLSLAAASPFDLIVTGRKTLGPEDLELLHKIRAVRPHLRLIILTDEFTPGDVTSAMREGAFSYFSAPFQPAELAEMVRAAMAEPCWDDGIELLSATPAWVRLIARCDIATANRLVQFLRGVKDPNIPDEDKEDIIAAFREILLNAMEQAAISIPVSTSRSPSSAHVVPLSAASRIQVRAFHLKRFATPLSTVRPAISLATSLFAKPRTFARVASAFC
jgi:CheY-like chemotaxis protein